MTKITKKISIIAAIIAVALLSTVALAACNPYKWGPVSGGSGAEATTSNGGYAAEQDGYLYFVNGKTGILKDDVKANKFGAVIKGAIYKAKINADGTLGEAKCLVPKNIYTETKSSAGIFIFGRWIYYATPTTSADNNGKLRDTQIDYFRTTTDGTKTQKIATIESTSLEFKFTPTGMIYFEKEKKDISYGSEAENDKLYVIPYDDNKVFAQKTAAEKVTGKYFPSSSKYDPKNPAASVAQDSVYYTVATTNKEVTTGNSVYALNGKGESTAIVDVIDYTDGNAPTTADKVRIYNITIKQLNITATGDIELYYEKASYPGNTTEYTGLFGVKLEVKDGKIQKLVRRDQVADAANGIKADNGITFAGEKRFTRPAEASVSGTLYPISLAEGVLIIGDPTTLEKPKNGSTDIGGSDRESYKAITSSFTVLSVDLAANSITYLDGSKLLLGSAKREANTPNAIILSESVDTSWLNIDVVGDYVYYINSAKKHDYLVRISASASGKEFDNEEKTVIKDNLLGEMTKTDKEAYDKELESK